MKTILSIVCDLQKMCKEDRDTMIRIPKSYIQDLFDMVTDSKGHEKAFVVKGDNWEGLYVGMEIIDQYHRLEEGEERVEYFLDKSKEYGFSIYEIEWFRTNDSGEEYLAEFGKFPDHIVDFYGMYFKDKSK